MNSLKKLSGKVSGLLFQHLHVFPVKLVGALDRTEVLPSSVLSPGNKVEIIYQINRKAVDISLKQNHELTLLKYNHTPLSSYNLAEGVIY